MYYLGTTGISKIWDINKPLLLLGPWCAISDQNKQILKEKEYTMVPTPWKSAQAIQKSLDYCRTLEEKLLPQLTESLNKIHQVSYSSEYWKIVLYPWLVEFIGILFDRYSRIKKTLEIFPSFRTAIFPKNRYSLASYNMIDFMRSIYEDHYNLVLFSEIIRILCPDQSYETDYVSQCTIFKMQHSWKRRFLTKVLKPLELSFQGSLLLSDMYHLTFFDRQMVRLKIGWGNILITDFSDLRAREENPEIRYSEELRKGLKLSEEEDPFYSLVCRLIPRSMPTSYVEEYSWYRKKILQYKSVQSVKAIGTAVGWNCNEGFKFFAAEAVEQGAKALDFQHGGGYGASLINPHEEVCKQKEISYRWGIAKCGKGNVKLLPSPHLSRLRDTHTQKGKKIVFVSASNPRYHYRFQSQAFPEDILKYYEEKKIFFKKVRDEIKKRVLYRPCIHSFGWGGEEEIKKCYPEFTFIEKGRLVSWMQKAQLVVVDQPQTVYLEALTINVPSVFYWDNEVYPMRKEATEYFERLRKANILFYDPKEAAHQVNEIAGDPMKWWQTEEVQRAREKFLDHFACTSKNWMNEWVEELKQFV